VVSFLAPIKLKPGFKVCLSKCNLHRYTEADAAGTNAGLKRAKDKTKQKNTRSELADHWGWVGGWVFFEWVGGWVGGLFPLEGES
jgi:hypothetical protein